MTSPFHAGDVGSAIALAKAKGFPLLVAVHTPGDASSDALESVWRDDAVASELRSRWVALRLERLDGDRGADFRSFAALFPVAGAHAVVAINPGDGAVLFERGARAEARERERALDADEWRAEIARCRDAFDERARAAALAALARIAAAGPLPAPAANAAARADEARATTERDAAPRAPAPAPETRPARATDPTRRRNEPTSPERERDAAPSKRPVATPPAKEAPPESPPPETNAKARRENPSSDEKKTTSGGSGGEETPAEEEEKPASFRATTSVRVSVAPAGASLTRDFPLGAVVRDVVQFVAEETATPEARVKLYTTWPRRRVDEADPSRTTLESLGLGARISLVAETRGAGGGGGARGRAAPSPLARRSGAGASASASAALGGVFFFRRLGDLLGALWGWISTFLGLGDFASPGDGPGGPGRSGASSPAPRGGGASGARRRPASGAGPRGNVHTLASRGGGGGGDPDDESTRNRFDNGNSTLWGGGGDDPGDDGGGGGGGDVSVF
jgi:hypothetical protein